MLGVDQVDEVQGKHILDLAAGNGVLGLATMMLGASKVTLVEADEQAIHAAEVNIERTHAKVEGRASIIQAMIGRDSI